MNVKLEPYNNFYDRDMKYRKQRLPKSKQEGILRQKTLERGETFWFRFDGNAPRASGLKEQDKQRLKLFKIYISKLKQENKEALEAWLCYKLNALERDSEEFISSTIENWEINLKKIYTEHLEVFSDEPNC
jgi:hypothetical protein